MTCSGPAQTVLLQFCPQHHGEGSKGSSPGVGAAPGCPRTAPRTQRGQSRDSPRRGHTLGTPGSPALALQTPRWHQAGCPRTPPRHRGHLRAGRGGRGPVRAGPPATQPRPAETFRRRRALGGSPELQPEPCSRAGPGPMGSGRRRSGAVRGAARGHVRPGCTCGGRRAAAGAGRRGRFGGAPPAEEGPGELAAPGVQLVARPEEAAQGRQLPGPAGGTR